MTVHTRRFEPVVQLDSGLIIPSEAAAGLKLGSDGSGNATWGFDHGDDALQPGFMGTVNPTTPITATMNVTTSVLTFSNWPTGDVVYFKSTNGNKIRGIVPSAPTTLSPAGSGIGPNTSGNYQGIIVALAPPTSDGGTCSVAIFEGGATTLGYTTAALAAAELQTYSVQGMSGYASPYGGQALIAWDGICHWVSGTGYTLVSGTAASGYGGIVPAATGRDRRPWARGAYTNYEPGGIAPATTTAGWIVMYSGASIRQEYMGVGVVRVQLLAQIKGNEGEGFYGEVGCLCDGTLVCVNTINPIQANWNTNTGPIQFEYDLSSVGPGSHLWQPAWYNVTAGSGYEMYLSSSDDFAFTVWEDMVTPVSNGTA